MSLSQIESKFEPEFVQNGWIQDGRIQDGSHHQVNQIELVWVRVEGECFWVNLREDKKVSESKMAVSESNMIEFKMAAIIKLSQNEWVKVFFVQMVVTNLGKCEWVWEETLRWLNPRWPNSRLQNSRWLPSSSWVRMNKFESDWISLRQKSEWRESVFEWIWEKIRRCLNPRWQCLNPTW